ncbi:sulfotransferase, partial [Roseobacter sp. GAI101]|uniref:sulfotransferase n=1 Tax=Roseobacter sp. (strain GAI101) TaxID=391589 RepID=UPI00018723DB
MPEKPRYIFILTTGHSGGTLLNLLLGASPAIFAAGESLRLWTLGAIDRQSEDTRDFWGTAADALATQGWAAKDLDRRRVEEAPMDLWRTWTTIVSQQAQDHIIADKSLSFKLIRKICEANIVDPFFVHLIRDPRGVDCSFRRKYGRSWRTAVTWQKSNFAIERFLRGKPNTIRLRYEDLCAFPDAQMRSVLRT